MAGKKKSGAIWKQLGMKQVMSKSGKSVKGYQDAQGNYISERQFRQKFTNKPMKGSKKPTTAEEKTQRQIDVAWNQIEQAAKKPGMTLKEFFTGKAPKPPKERTMKEHNDFVDKYRREAIEFKRMAGAITNEEAKDALKWLKEEKRWRTRAQHLNDRLNGDLSREERRRLGKEYRKASAKYREAHGKLSGRGFLDEDAEPGRDSLSWMWYHS